MQSDRTKASRSEPRFEERDSLVQAVFGGREVVAETASNVEVVVKRRRTLHADDGTTIDGLPSDGTAVRAPRVFKIEGARPPASSQAEKVDLRPAPRESSPHRRRRRVLHGEVKVIRPSPRELLDEAAQQASDLPGRPEPSYGLLDFDMISEAKGRYELLLTQIAKLRRQADAAKKAEAAIAVRWIRKAILEYQIGPDDLGL